MLYIPQSMKACSKCGEWKVNSKTHFNRDGKILSARCKTCESKRKAQHYASNAEHLRAKAREYYLSNKANILEYQHEYHKANREHIAQRARRWRCANKEHLKERKRRYYEANRTIIIRRVRKWRGVNWDRVLSYRYSATRRARKYVAHGTHAAADIRHQHEVQQGRCYYCNTEVGDKYHADHYIPLNKGGSNGPENIVIACPTCNTRKQDKMPDEFIAILRGEKIAREADRSTPDK